MENEMVGTKKSKKWPAIFRRLKSESRKIKLLKSALLFKCKRPNLELSFMDDLVFKIFSVLEAIVLVTTLCFFFLCCGCQF